MMDLKFRRNLPLLLLFLATVAVLVLGLGNQPILAYTFEASGDGENSSATEVHLLDEINQLFELTAAEGVDISAPAGDTAGSNVSTSFVSADTYPTQNQETAVILDGAGLSTLQPD